MTTFHVEVKFPKLNRSIEFQITHINKKTAMEVVYDMIDDTEININRL